MSEDAPQFLPVNESQRIEDPEKAHVMALAGDELRSQAVEFKDHAKQIDRSGGDYSRNKELARQQAQEFHQAVKLNEAADAAEVKAGERYELEKDRIQDPERAHEMALAGGAERTQAAEQREYGDVVIGEGYPRQGQYEKSKAIPHDELAEEAEEEAGRQYDEQHALPEREMVEPLGMSVDEFIDLYRTYKEFDKEENISAYIENQAVFNHDFCNSHPELALDIYRMLASDESSKLRRTAAIGLDYIVNLHPEESVEILQKLLSDQDSDVSSEALDSLEDILGSEDIPFTFTEAAPMLKVYAEELKKKQSEPNT